MTMIHKYTRLRQKSVDQTTTFIDCILGTKMKIIHFRHIWGYGERSNSCSSGSSMARCCCSSASRTLHHYTRAAGAIIGVGKFLPTKTILKMTTVLEENVHNFAVDGSSDDLDVPIKVRISCKSENHHHDFVKQ